MDEFEINVNQVEDLQITNGMMDLKQILKRAHNIIVQGGTVVLVRNNTDGSSYRVDEITTEIELKTYKDKVFKYM